MKLQVCLNSFNYFRRKQLTKKSASLEDIFTPQLFAHYYLSCRYEQKALSLNFLYLISKKQFSRVSIPPSIQLRQ